MTKNEFIRLTEADPIVLKIGPLTSFLWEDFVRDTSPIVKYLEHDNIHQLSRIGVELFDLLYQGGECNFVIEIDDIESYFRATQNGEDPPIPKGYEAENAFWVNLFSDIVESPGWKYLAQTSVGDQFNSGNNSINIINGLVNALADKIDELRELQELGKTLSDIRNKFLKAQQDFENSGSKEDLKKAVELRQKGKQLKSEIESKSKLTKDNLNKSVATTVENAKQAAKDIQNAVNNLAGNQDGVGERLNDLQEKKKLASHLSKNASLKKVIDRLGSLRKAWSDRKRDRLSRTNYSEVVGAKFTDDVVKAYSTEIALAATDEGKVLFAHKYSQKTLLTKDFEAKTKELNKGPVVMYVDISGSMMGPSEIWSKAIALVVAEECMSQKRELQIHLFDTRVQKSITLSPHEKNHRNLMDFICEWVTRGGTNFSVVIDHALTQNRLKDKADVLFITDGQSVVGRGFLDRLDRFKESTGAQWTSFCIGQACSTLDRMSDYVYTVDINSDPENCELFQSSLR